MQNSLQLIFFKKFQLNIQSIATLLTLSSTYHIENIWERCDTHEKQAHIP
ncbi:hypothetical protein HanXRQr2_Chr17g0829491 [Helianthus annuus]|uniref:Uncharacterized protein n=1 Tax=Helianthus annuus TaxID=4232 RepID=A0A9K3GWP7_HELAN|nr:hypothetical protein HanXRQr2_Chr17g0829491 [Helianthus annuus]